MLRAGRCGNCCKPTSSRCRNFGVNCLAPTLQRNDSAWRTAPCLRVTLRSCETSLTSMRCLTCLSGAKDCDPLFGSLFTFLTLLRLAQPSWLVLPFAGFARPSGSHCFYTQLCRALQQQTKLVQQHRPKRMWIWQQPQDQVRPQVVAILSLHPGRCFPEGKRPRAVDGHDMHQ